MLTYKSTVYRRLPFHPGGDFAVIEVKAAHGVAATRMIAEILAKRKMEDYDWRYSPIMLIYDYELEATNI